MSDAKPRRGVRDPAEKAAALDTPVPRAAAPVGETSAVVSPSPSPAAAPQPEIPSSAAFVEPKLMATARPEPAQDAVTALAAMQTALGRGFEQIAVEMTGITRSGVAAGSDAVLALLAARTLAEAVEINARMARRGLDAIVEGSARLSEIGVRALVEASRPILTQFSAI